jgi:flagellar protein FlaG
MEVSQLLHTVNRPVANAAPSVPGSPRAIQEKTEPDPTSPAALAESQQQQNAPPNPLDPETLQKAVERLNKTVQSSMSTNLVFSVDAETDITVVKVVDKTTGEVIRQIPSEEALAIAKSIGDLQGLVVRDKA